MFGSAGLNVGATGSITIDGTGSLIADGIGSGDEGTAGNITITGGTVNATGGTQGAGIGCGYAGEVGDITYVEECVTATGGYYSEDNIGKGTSGSIVGTITTIPLSTATTTTCGDGLILHVADQNASYNKIAVYIDSMRTTTLNIDPLDVSDQESAGFAIDRIKNAINYVSTNRANVGALQNRLERTINNNNNTSENMSSAKSTIKDTDMAAEMMEYTKMNVLTQAAQSMLAQSNQAPQSILELLG